MENTENQPVTVTPATVRKIHRKVMEAEAERDAWLAAQVQTELAYSTSS